MKKSFIGLCDIGSCFDNWNEGFNRNKIKAIKGSKHFQSAFQNSHLDFVIERAKNRVSYFKPGRISVRFKPWWDKFVSDYYFRKAIRECDIFVFVWFSFNHDFSDYKILKEKGKKIITLFVGDDVRWKPAMEQEFLKAGLTPFEYENYDSSVSELEKKLIFLRTAEKYSDMILSQPNISQLALRPYHNLNIPIISKWSKTNTHQRVKPIIVHAPTSIGKGTKFIEPIIEKLKEEGLEFEYIRIQNIPRQKALDVYENADIILDQILLPGGGGLTYDSLAMGKVVLTLMANNKYDQKKSKKCPIVDISEETLYDILKDIIPNQAKRIEIAAMGRPYIEKYHNPKEIVANILNHLDGSKLMEPDFYPAFFREQFIPESEEAKKVYNKWANYVKDCDWYKKYVSPGERAGLKF